MVVVELMVQLPLIEMLQEPVTLMPVPPRMVTLVTVPVEAAENCTKFKGSVPTVVTAACMVQDELVLTVPAVISV